MLICFICKAYASINTRVAESESQGIGEFLVQLESDS